MEPLLSFCASLGCVNCREPFGIGACETGGRSAPAASPFTGNRMRRAGNLLPSVFHHKSGRLKVTLHLTGLESLSMPRATVRQMQGRLAGALKCSLFNWRSPSDVHVLKAKHFARNLLPGRRHPKLGFGVSCCNRCILYTLIKK